MHTLILLVGCLVIFSNSAINAFNISPKPNLVLKEPTILSNMPKLRSSYFGFSINLRTNSVLVAAPRAQSALPMQSAVNETGAIYKCPLDTALCEPYVFDEQGNVATDYDDILYQSQHKDFQWLGAGMDGNSLENDWFVVCAPRMTTKIEEDTCAGSTDQSMCMEFIIPGVCYWTPNTIDAQPRSIRRIAPFRLKARNDYHYGELGLSVHITDNNKEIIFGAPGLGSWHGSIVRYRESTQGGIGGLSRRDTSHSAPITRLASVKYVTDIPTPLNLSRDSYFGYAITSGYFLEAQPDKLLYVASAPQANHQQGEVFIFDIVGQNHSDIKVLHTFSSQQMGEYFGYALVADDFNNDTFAELAVAAPFHKNGMNSYDNGAVYIYRNLEGKSFDLHAILRSDYAHEGRFGTTITKIGDINNDGFKDLAVGAPYEGDGVVYIYLGGPKGLSVKASQRIVAPLLGEVPFAHMFGHGVSKGTDIDGNHYVDIAIGAPNAETVYVYKTYPVAEVVATITPDRKEIKTTDTTLKVAACWHLKSKFELAQDINFSFALKLDQLHGRALFADQTNLVERNVTASTTEQCIDFDVVVTYFLADIFKPIDLELSYAVLDGVPDSEEFCTKCVAINPDDPTMVKDKVVFSTGCQSDRCIADLRLKSNILSPMPYVLGSTKSLAINYQIENSGETAYLTQLNISVSKSITFMKIPSNCRQMSAHLLCDINGGSPLFQGDIGYFTIALDTTKASGSAFTVSAHVFSTGDELNDLDNVIDNVIPVTEFSDIEIIGKSNIASISLEDGLDEVNVIHVFEIRNNGPSTLMNLDVVLSIPMSILDTWSLKRINLMDANRLSVKCIYENQYFDPEWTQNHTVVLPNPTHIAYEPILISGIGGGGHMNGMDFDSSKIGLEYDFNAGSINDPAIEAAANRKRRSVDTVFRSYNRYTRSVDEHQVSARISAQNPDDATLSNLPINRSFMFECTEVEMEYCLRARFSVHNFLVGNAPILISLNLSLDLMTFDKVITEARDIFVIRTSAHISKPDDHNGQTFNVVQTRPYTIISKYHARGTPIWVYVVSSIGGLLALVLITFGLYKMGFFKRTKKEELDQIKRKSVAAPLATQAGTEHLDD